MFDYRNNLKTILNKTQGDDRSLQNSLSAIKTIIGMADSNADITPTTKKMPNTDGVSMTSETENQIKMLINNLALLIEVPGDKVAKTNSLNALHKLTFTAGIGKKFGKNLGKLDQAIQKSVESEAAVNKKIFEKAVTVKETPKKDYRKGRRYTVIRAVTGADLITDNGDVAFEVDESQIHSLNLKSGDIVEALPLDGNRDKAEVLRVVGYRKLRQRDYDPISEFKYGVVQGSPGNFSVSRNIRGEKLVINHKPVVVFLDSSFYGNNGRHLTDGSIVDLAWYDGDVRLKKDPASAIQVRWIYETEQPQRVGKSKKIKYNSTENNDPISKLDLDLHYQRVGIAIGDNQNEAILEGIVNRYNGIPIPIDAFEGKKKVMEKQIKDLDIVVLVTAFAAHDATWNIQEFASKYKVKFAVSSSKGYKSFERALYRAAKGLPAYEGNQKIDYEIVKD